MMRAICLMACEALDGVLLPEWNMLDNATPIRIDTVYSIDHEIANRWIEDDRLQFIGEEWKYLFPVTVDVHY
jgi:hypothetical protein